ncbi:hypothetical protein BWQ96_06471 [Gracilariopsis chorda]|uniref:Uncharacterized protein n=1 Tax=Gracilariopsis chorda TaxID=448386 RepID=A0A2V3INW9_9FLOR|nr:hypothetical protein BWQ96_06471 [Gracilariopsis chorda]|eukprot:PXF43778.1 hypothetical protein BWQ96_06471 [Gracilariopsis chorda]
MDHVNWDLVRNEHRTRGSLALSTDHSPGRTSNQGGDFIWYDPWTREHVTTEAAKHLHENPRAMSTTQPVGYVFAPQPVNSDALDDEEGYDDPVIDEMDDSEYVDLDNIEGPMPVEQENVQ